MNRTLKTTHALKDFPENNEQDVNDNLSFKWYPQRIMNRALKTTNALKDFPENIEQDANDNTSFKWYPRDLWIWRWRQPML